MKDWSIYKHPSAGSIFKRRSFLAKKLLDGLRIGDAKLKGNFICNLGTASFNDVFMANKSFKNVKLPYIQET